jgi:hypothetical protein
MTREKPAKGGEDRVGRCGHLESLHLLRWRDASVANKCERCPDAEPCPGYVPRTSRESLAPAVQPPEPRTTQRPPTRARDNARRSARPAVRPGRKSWTIAVKHYPVWRLKEDGTREEHTGWELTCPKGHLLRAFAAFGSLPVPLRVWCDGCRRDYPVKLGRVEMRRKGRP